MVQPAADAIPLFLLARCHHLFDLLCRATKLSSIGISLVSGLFLFNAAYIQSLPIINIFFSSLYTVICFENATGR
jgi:hypothetical protein